MKKVSILICALLILSLVLCACGGGKSSLIGTWTGTQDGVSISMTFNEDKTGSMAVMGGLITAGFTYTDDGSKLILTPDEGMEDYMSFSEITYSIDGDTMTVTGDGDTVTMTRQ